MDKILQIEYDETDFISLRDRLVFELLYATGMRVSEMVNLEERNIDFYAKTIKVLGKRNKERFIPLTDFIIDLIKKFQNIKTQEIEFQSIELLTDLKGQKISRQKCYEIIKTILTGMHLDKRSPHVLRHSFATHLLNHGADINTVKTLLGHSSLAATQIYTHSSIEELKKSYQKAFPKA
jgi:integrase/recombinase XerC